MAALLLLVVLGALEVLARRGGHLPCVKDDMDLWCQQREEATRRGRDTLALLGTSRMQAGLATEVFRREFPMFQTVQLAISGQYPAATLKDLANDEGFSGIVVSELPPIALLLPKCLASQEGHVRHFHEAWNSQKKLERTMRTLIQENVACLAPDLNMRSVASSLWWGSRIEPSTYRVLPDRAMPMEFHHISGHRINALKTLWITEMRETALLLTRVPEREEWVRQLRSVERLVNRIERRGGKVVFVCFPTSGKLNALIDQMFPRAAFWDELARETHASTVHYKDLPGATKLSCVDESHLDSHNAALFTKMLADELRRRGLLGGARRRMPADLSINTRSRANANH